MKILEIRDRSLLVLDQQGERTAIAKHTDEGGDYFLDWQLDKRYVKDAELAEPEDEEPEEEETDSVPHNRKGRWTFETTMYDNEGYGPGRTYTRTFKADSLGEAGKKHTDAYGQYIDDYFDAVLIEAKDRDGNNININELFK